MGTLGKMLSPYFVVLFFVSLHRVYSHQYVSSPCVCLGLQMSDVSLPVMMHQHVDNFFKQVRLLWAKEASSDLVNGLFQLGQPVIVLFSVVSAKTTTTNKKKG